MPTRQGPRLTQPDPHTHTHTHTRCPTGARRLHTKRQIGGAPAPTADLLAARELDALAEPGDGPMAAPLQAEPAPGDAPEGRARGKRTLYACEEKQLEIECQLGESIQLIRANYGRFSIQICNENGQVDWKVNCMSPASFQIIANR